MMWFKRVQSQPWLVFVVACIAMIAFGPRVPLDVLVPGRTFDLRVTDLALALALPIWVRKYGRDALRLPLARVVTVYLAIAILTTLVAIGIGGLNVLRGVFYLGKELEYYLLFFIVATTTRNARQVASTVLAFQVTAAISVIWFGYQLAVRHDQSLLSLEQFLPTDVFVSPGREDSYGPHLLGESSPFSVGGFFMLAFILNLALMLYRRGRNYLGHAAFACALLACLVLTQSRVSLAAAFIAEAAIVLALRSGRWSAVRGFVLVTIVGLALSTGLGYLHLSQELPPPVASPTPSPSFSAGSATPSPLAASPEASPEGLPNPESVGIARRLAPSAIEYSAAQRLDIWRPLVDAVIRRPLTGYGKESIGSIDGLGAGEAHNYFLRVAVETGVAGVLAFAAILVSLGVLCYRGVQSRWTQAGSVWAWGIGATVAMASSALLQDAFVPVILAELYWIAAGTAVAATALTAQSASQVTVARRNETVHTNS